MLTRKTAVGILPSKFILLFCDLRYDEAAALFIHLVMIPVEYAKFCPVSNEVSSREALVSDPSCHVGCRAERNPPELTYRIARVRDFRSHWVG